MVRALPFAIITVTGLSRMVNELGWRVKTRQMGVASSLPAAPISGERKHAVSP
jgi:hypothetical protein